MSTDDEELIARTAELASTSPEVAAKVAEMRRSAAAHGRAMGTTGMYWVESFGGRELKVYVARAEYAEALSEQTPSRERSDRRAPAEAHAANQASANRNIGNDPRGSAAAATQAAVISAGGNDEVADLAAKALLGALLWDPARVPDVAEWLEPADFGNWADRAVYQTITGLIADGQPVDLLQLPAVLARGDYHDAHVDRSGLGPLSAPALHSLISLTPATPRQGEPGGENARSEHVRYGRIVLEASIRRQVSAAGSRIEQHARNLPGQRSDHASEVLEPVLAETIDRLQELTSRLSTAGSTRSRIADALAPHLARPGPRPESRTAIAGGDGSPAPTAAQLGRAEYALIGASLVSGEVWRDVQGRLIADDFTTPAAGSTWMAMEELHRRGEPIDFVLAAAQVERQGDVQGRGPGLRPTELAKLARKFGDRVTGHSAAETVTRSALGRAAQHATEQLQSLAADRARPGDDVLRAAHDTITTMRTATGRLTGAAPTGVLAALAAPATTIPAARGAPTPQPVGRPAGHVPEPHQQRQR